MSALSTVNPPRFSAKGTAFTESSWKTHLVVVLSSLLFGIGYALAFSSIYLIVAIHVSPLTAATSSILSIAAGNLLNPYCAPTPPDPCGIVRPVTKNHCWASAAFQLLLSNDNFCKALEESSLQKDPLSFPGYLARAFRFHKRAAPLSSVSPIDPQVAIGWLKFISKDIRLAPTAQHSPTVVIEALSNLSLPCLQQVTEHYKNEEVRKRDPTLLLHSDFPIPLDPKPRYPFLDLVDSYFHDTAEASFERGFFSRKKEGYLKIDKRLASSPSYLFFSLNRVQVPPDCKNPEKGGMKNFNPVECPEQFTLPSSYTCENTIEYTYQMTGFTLHSGNAQGGHHIACVYQNQSWYLINDATVRKISSQEKDKLSKQALLVSYAKVLDLTNIPATT